MGLSTLLVAYLPTYAEAAWLAPLLLCILRFGQGFGLGGEWGGCSAAGGRACAAQASLGTLWRVSAAGCAGRLHRRQPGLFLVLGLMFTPEEFLAWVWRVPFALSALLIGVGLWMRLELAGNARVRQGPGRRAAAQHPLAELFCQAWPPCGDRHGPGRSSASSSLVSLPHLHSASALKTLGSGMEQFLAMQLGAICFMAVAHLSVGLAGGPALRRAQGARGGLRRHGRRRAADGADDGGRTVGRSRLPVAVAGPDGLRLWSARRLAAQPLPGAACGTRAYRWRSISPAWSVAAQRRSFAQALAAEHGLAPVGLYFRHVGVDQPGGAGHGEEACRNKVSLALPTRRSLSIASALISTTCVLGGHRERDPGRLADPGRAAPTGRAPPRRRRCAQGEIEQQQIAGACFAGPSCSNEPAHLALRLGPGRRYSPSGPGRPPRPARPNRHDSAPRDSASRPSAPEPANQSATVRPSKLPSAAGQHREQRLARAIRGRPRGSHGGARSTRRRHSPAMITHVFGPLRGGEDRREAVVERLAADAVLTGSSVRRLLRGRHLCPREDLSELRNRSSSSLRTSTARALGRVAERERPVGGPDQPRDLGRPRCSAPRRTSRFFALRSASARSTGCGLCAVRGWRRWSRSGPLRWSRRPSGLEAAPGNRPNDARAISARNARGRQFKLALEPAVVGQQQQTFGVEIEPSYRHNHGVPGSARCAARHRSSLTPPRRARR